MGHNLKEDIMQLVVTSLQNRVKSIMLNINILLSNPDKSDDIVGRISDLTIELSNANNALNQGIDLLSQVQQQYLEAYNKIMESSKKTDKTDKKQ